MEKLVIDGGVALNGTVAASGAKNAALPVLIATLVAPGEHRLANIPDLADTSSTLSLLGRIGCPSLGHGDLVRLDTSRIAFSEAPYDVVRKMRASVLVLGPLLARMGEAKVSLPGGCAIGVRPIDQHLKGLEALGCRFELANGYIHGHVQRLRGAEFRFDMVTVGGTENVVMAAALAEGTTVLHNSAQEPEIVDLCNFLNLCGAKISGVGTSTLVIQGVNTLRPAAAPYRILPDRIEAGTFLCAAAATGGDVTVTGTDPTTLVAVMSKLREAGCEVTSGSDWIRCVRAGPLVGVDITTEPHPGFPTDMQAQFMAVATQAQGTSVISETIFENRFLHAAELTRMGARIAIAGNTATVEGSTLTAATVMASDLRASAALVIAGLATPGMTQILRIYHLDRGYENMVVKLRGLGARIGRLADNVQDEASIRKSLDPSRPVTPSGAEAQA